MRGAAFVWLLARRSADASLIDAVAAGPFIAPYAGIYAAVPLLLALPRSAASLPLFTPGLAIIGIVPAPWSPLASGLLLISAFWRPRRI